MRELPPFLKKLFSLVNDNSWGELIRWENNGQNFIILDPSEFSRKILPAYFKHKNFSSFVRQLNQYGFSKLSSDQWIFGHKNFRYGQKEQLTAIIRKKKNNNITNFSNENSQNFHQKLEADIDLLKKSRQSFSKNFLDLLSRQEKFLLQQQNIEINQQKFESQIKILENEVCQLKSFIFSYLSKIIGKEEGLGLANSVLFPDIETSVEKLRDKKAECFFLCKKIKNQEKIVCFD